MGINFGNNDFQTLPAAFHQIEHYNTTSGTHTQNSGSFVNVSGFTDKTITPKSSDSKILIHICGFNYAYYSSNGGATLEARILRNGGQVWESIINGRNNAGHYHGSWAHIMFFDNPATTNQTTYKFQIRECHGNTAVAWNRYDGNTGSNVNFRSDMYLIEVGDEAL